MLYPQYKSTPIDYIQEVLKSTITFDQKKIINMLMDENPEAGKPRGRVLVLSCHSAGKCINLRNIIYLADGSRVKAADLVGKSFDLFTINPETEQIVKAKAYADWNRVEDNYEIITESGRKIERNSRHPLWTAKGTFKRACRTIISPNGWTAVSDIVEGDLVAVTEELPNFGEEYMNEDQIKVLAYLIGDGGMTAKTPGFTQMQGKQLDEFKVSVNNLGCQVNCLDLDKYQYSVTGFKSNNKSRQQNHITYFLNQLGLMGKHSRGKFIPEEIFRLNKQQTNIFLTRLFSTDGWASTSHNIKSKNASVQIGFCSISEQLVRDVSDLCLKFGVCGRIRHRKKVNAWCWEVSKGTDVLAFLENIGFIYGKEEACQRVYDNAKILSQSKRSEVWRHRKALKGTRWEKVKSIKNIGPEMTVAIEVEKYHTYLTNFYEHNSYLAGSLVNWHYDCFDPSITITTAPSEKSVNDIIWREIRTGRAHLPEDHRDLQPAAPRMQNSPNHFAEGLVAAKAQGFHGRKSPNMFIVFDECDGIKSSLWDAARGMLIRENAKWLCLLNPVDISSRAYMEYEDEAFQTLHLSALNHPNVIADLENIAKYGRAIEELRPYPGIDMNKNWVDGWVRGGKCRPIEKGDLESTDFEWPPGSGEWFRPNGEVESRVLGVWPTESSISLWNDAMWRACSKPQPEDIGPVEIGCDPAWMGSDASSIVVRRGRTALHCEKHYQWDSTQIAEQLKILATEFGAKAGMTAETVPVKIDITGSQGVYDQRGNFNFIGVNSSSTKVLDPESYKNRRSEMWFNAALLGNTVIPFGDNNDLIPMIDVSRLYEVNAHMAKSIKKQLMAPRWFLRAGGLKEVEPKDKTKTRLGGESPDDADAFNLAFAEYRSDDSTRTVFSRSATKALNKGYGSRYRK